jgi:tRNA threonylcarbamoyladenosine biosynthesis protein TsaB
MRVLALDTATEACSVALLTDAGSIDRFAEVGRAHAEEILELVDGVLAEAGVALSELDGIAAGVGPGSFTGVRISVSVAQGLAFGAGLRVVAVTSLETLALRALDAGAERALACLDARMGEVYWGCFAAHAVNALTPLSDLKVGPAASVQLPGAGRYRGIGRGFDAYPELAALPGVETDLDDRRALPHAREMARLGAIRLRAGQGIDPADLEPRYVRNKVAFTEAERHAAPWHAAS